MVHIKYILLSSVSKCDEFASEEKFGGVVVWETGVTWWQVMHTYNDKNRRKKERKKVRCRNRISWDTETTM